VRCVVLRVGVLLSACSSVATRALRFMHKCWCEWGMMLGLNGIAGDEEVLLGDSSQPGFGLGGFKFEPNRLSFGLTPSKSRLGSQVRGLQFGCRCCVVRGTLCRGTAELTTCSSVAPRVLVQVRCA
jgi:hypothetical protein